MSMYSIKQSLQDKKIICTHTVASCLFREQSSRHCNSTNNGSSPATNILVHGTPIPDSSKGTVSSYSRHKQVWTHKTRPRRRDSTRSQCVCNKSQSQTTQPPLVLITIARNKSKASDKNTTNPQTQAKLIVISSVQRHTFKDEIKKLQGGEQLSKQSPLSTLSPCIDSDGLLRVGGRTSLADLPYDERHPFILPKKQHVSTLLVRHYHQSVAHQGRHLTKGLLRSAGVWIIGARKLLSSVIYQCVTCRKLRGKPAEQKMANLPKDRLSIEPPFTSVGIDVFGPWSVVSRKTRGGCAESKRWAVMFSAQFTSRCSSHVHLKLY